MADQIGQQVGNYRLTRILGRGSFGSVYLAEHLHLQASSAVKLLHGQVEAHEMAAFLQEARTIASLKHAHILRVLDFGFEQGMPYLVMEYAPNGTLRQKHPRGSRVPTTTVLTYVQQIATGLQYAHNRELIHRDIKPENMLLDEHEQVVLGDFGISLKGSRKLTEKDVAGTAIYMAPEQIQGKPRRASDQYALGIMVYEWLAGNPPFQGDFYSLVGQHLSTPVPPLEKVPPLVARVVYKALEKLPENRFATVTAFADALEHAVTGDQRKPEIQENIGKKGRSVALQKPQWPQYGLLYAFISGIIAGPLSGGVVLVINLFSSSSILSMIVGLGLAVVICCVAGFVTGKTAVARKMGWVTGLATGISFGVLGSITSHVPILTDIEDTLIALLVSIPLTFCGVWLATRTHPYYRKQGAGE